MDNMRAFDTVLKQCYLGDDFIWLMIFSISQYLVDAFENRSEDKFGIIAQFFSNFVWILSKERIEKTNDLLVWRE